MNFRFPLASAFAVLILWVPAVWSQDLGPGFTKVKDGIYVYAAKDGNSTCSIILTEEGVVIIDTCQTPPDGHHLLATVKKLTDKPIRFVIDTEVHSDHTFDHFIFSPPAIVINHEGATEGMKKNTDPKRVETLAAQSPEMREAVKGYRMVTPQIEYKDRMTIHLGERTFELIYLKNVHSEADEAIWLPKERVLFAASAANVRTIINLRPFVRIPGYPCQLQTDEVVEPGSGRPRPWRGKHYENLRRVRRVLYFAAQEGDRHGT